MFDIKTALGAITVITGLISYSFYYADIFRNKTKPDGFSWLIWGVLAAITFFAQMSKHAGPGAWATGLTAIACTSIAVTAFVRNPAKIKPIDIASLAGALGGLVLWIFTDDPLIAVVLAVAVGGMGFVPTFRKAFEKPLEETQMTYLLNAIKFMLALLALAAYNLVTVLYPAAMVLMNLSLVTLITVRSKK